MAGLCRDISLSLSAIRRDTGHWQLCYGGGQLQLRLVQPGQTDRGQDIRPPQDGAVTHRIPQQYTRSEIRSSTQYMALAERCSSMVFAPLNMVRARDSP